MARSDGPRTVQCYLCAHRFDVSAMALSASCPGCHRNIVVEDIHLKKNLPKLVMRQEVMTCGRIVVPKGARLVADVVIAQQGLEVKGTVEARQVIGGPLTLIAKKASFKGDLRTEALIVEDKATIHSGFFRVPDTSLGLSDLPPPPD